MVRVHWSHPGPFGDAFDVAVDGAPVEGLAVLSFEQISVASRSPPCLVVGDETD